MASLRNPILPALLWLIISTILLLLPGSRFPKVGWAENLHIDKLVHFVMFGLMMFLWCRFVLVRLPGYFPAGKKLRAASLQALVWAIYGIGMEYIQHNYIPRRSYDVGDIWADLAGVAAGFFLVYRTYIKK